MLVLKGYLSFLASERTANTPLHHFRVAVDDVDLRIQKQGTQGLLDEDEDGGCTVAVRTHAKLLLLVEVTAPFDDAPVMRVMFETEDGSRHEYPLRLPVVATCFMEPVTLEPAAFMQRWKSLEGQDRECQEVVKAPAGAPPLDEEYMARIAKIILGDVEVAIRPHGLCLELRHSAREQRT
jgi:AP-2 complex subunit alpha